MWRRILSVTAWVAVLAVLGPGGGAPAADGRGSRPADVAGAAARLDALTVAITGSVAELRASELLGYHRVEGGVAACMAEAGRPYRKQPFVSAYGGFTDADVGYGAGRATIIDSVTEHGRRLILNELNQARIERAGQGPIGVSHVAPADVDTYNRCAAPYGHRSYRDFDPPPGAYELAGFGEILDAVGADAEVAAAYAAYRPCMRRTTGEDVADRGDFLFRPRLTRAAAPGDGQPSGAAWERGLAAVEAAFAADAECRLPAYREAMRVVAANLDAWETRHRAELATIREGWEQRVTEAERLPR